MPQVYSVMGGYDYEGLDGASLRLFDCRSTAEAYCDELEKEFGYDHVEVKVMNIVEGSALAA
jgi:hypothetical protein